MESKLLEEVLTGLDGGGPSAHSLLAGLLEVLLVSLLEEPCPNEGGGDG